MRITLNGEAREIASRDMEALLRELDYHPEAVATALNRDFVPRVARPTTVITDGDAVEVLSPMKGG